MLDAKWCRMHADSGSWHAIQNESKVIEGASAAHPTYCGREADGPVVEDLPGTGKPCDTCDRKVIRINESLAKQEALAQLAAQA
jgi:hypothetical protein